MEESVGKRSDCSINEGERWKKALGKGVIVPSTRVNNQLMQLIKIKISALL